jgi:hypothetical protein
MEPDETGSGTLLRVRHRGLPDDASRHGHDEGWRYFLDRLETAVA